MLLHVDSGAYHGVNRVGALIWELLERPIPFRDLLNALSGQFSDAPAAMADEVNAFLTDLHARDLVEIVPEDRQT